MKRAILSAPAMHLSGAPIAADIFSMPHPGITEPSAEVLPVAVSPAIFPTIPDISRSRPHFTGAARAKQVFSYRHNDNRGKILMQKLNSPEGGGIFKSATVGVTRPYVLILDHEMAPETTMYGDQ
jgi:hypothetical protein